MTLPPLSNRLAAGFELLSQRIDIQRIALARVSNQAQGLLLALFDTEAATHAGSAVIDARIVWAEGYGLKHACHAAFLA